LSSNSKTDRAFTLRFIDSDTKVCLELMNTTDQTLKSVEILTVFLKAEPTNGDAVEAHLRFEEIKVIMPQAKAIPAHRTWINGRPVNDEQDQLARLKLIEGQSSPYVLDLSWQNSEGKTRFQRIPVGQLSVPVSLPRPAPSEETAE
jgi:hypothetical protein